MNQSWQGVDEEDRGLLYDLPTLMTRRRALGLLTGSGIVRRDITSSFGTSTARRRGAADDPADRAGCGHR